MRLHGGDRADLTRPQVRASALLRIQSRYHRAASIMGTVQSAIGCAWPWRLAGLALVLTAVCGCREGSPDPANPVTTMTAAPPEGAVVTTIANYVPQPPPAGPSPGLVNARQSLATAQSSTQDIHEAEAAVAHATAALRLVPSPVSPERATVTHRIAELERKLAVERQQVAADECCHQCGETKAEIEAGGEDYEKHIADNGPREGCKPEKLAAVVNRYERQIGPLKQKVVDLAQESGGELADARLALSHAQMVLDQARRDHAASVREAVLKVKAEESAGRH